MEGHSAHISFRNSCSKNLCEVSEKTAKPHTLMC